MLGSGVVVFELSSLVAQDLILFDDAVYPA